MSALRLNLLLAASLCCAGLALASPAVAASDEDESIAMAAADASGGYAGKVLNKIVRLWSPPPDTLNRRVSVRLRIDGNGFLKQCDTMTPSDMPEMNKAACAAAKEARDFGIPPYGMPIDVFVTFWTGRPSKNSLGGKQPVTMPEAPAKPQPSAVPVITVKPAPKAEEKKAATLKAAEKKADTKPEVKAEAVKPMGRKVEPEPAKPAVKAEPPKQPVGKKVEPEPAKAEVKAEPPKQPVGRKVEPEPAKPAVKAEPPKQPVGKKIDPTPPVAETTKKADAKPEVKAGPPKQPVGRKVEPEPAKAETPKAAAKTEPVGRKVEAPKPEPAKAEPAKAEPPKPVPPPAPPKPEPRTPGSTAKQAREASKASAEGKPEPRTVAAAKQPREAGDASNADKAQASSGTALSRYTDDIVFMARPRVTIPKRTPSGRHTVTVKLKVDGRGMVGGMSVDKPSASTDLDQAVLTALTKLGKLSAPPDQKAHTLHLTFTIVKP